jgi:hypothetical protein
MASQTTVANRMTRGFPGMIADSSFLKNVRSYVSTESSAEIPFGVMVVEGTDPATHAVLPHTSASASEQKLLGVVAHSHAYAKPQELGDSGLKPAATLGVLTHGVILVRIEEDVDPGDHVRVRVVAGGSEQAGEFRATADSTDCIDISAFARWVSSGTAAEGFAELEIDMTNRASASAD